MDHERPRPNLSILVPPASERPNGVTRQRGPAQILTILTPARVDAIVDIAARTLMQRDEHCASCSKRFGGRVPTVERVATEAAARVDARRLVERLLEAMNSPIAVGRPRRPRLEPLPPLAS